MEYKNKPRVVISKCIEHSACRYNGELIPNEFVKRLSKHVEFITVCPEVEIGLGIPRDPVRIIKKKNGLKLIQPSTSKDLTKKIDNFSKNYSNNLDNVDGFILKSRSPSCGVGDAKVYFDNDSGSTQGKTNGFFTNHIVNQFNGFPIEHEARLSNFRIRENFLTKIFMFSSFRNISKNPKIQKLIEFHSRNKLLLMSHSQKHLRILGRITANQEDTEIKDLYKNYFDNLKQALARLPRIGTNINVLQHAFGYFTENLTKKERLYFLELTDSYKNQKIPLSALITVIRSWIIKYDIEYLLNQTYFRPYPEDLIAIKDSGTGRKL